MSAVSLATISAISRKSSLVTKNSSIAFQSSDSMIEVMLQRIYTTTDDIATPSALATAIGYSSSCSVDTISGSTRDGSYEAVLYDINGNKILCSDTNWHDIVRKVVFSGTYSQNDRAIEISITPSCNKVVIGTKTYQTASFGDDCWMAEDLQVVVASGSYTVLEDDTISIAPGNVTGERYPKTTHYSWSAAMKGSTTPGDQGICPAGWHIPTRAEFDRLTTFTQDRSLREWKPQSRAWAVWKSIDYDRFATYTPESYFNAIPSGFTLLFSLPYFPPNYSSIDRGKAAYFWTSDSVPGVHYAYKWVAYEEFAIGSQSSITADVFAAVRCMKSIK